MANGIKRWGLGLVCVLLIAGGINTSASELPTVGSFMQKLAQLNGLDASTPAGAERSLRAAGYRIPADLDLSLTLNEGRVASISRAMGLAVTTRRPSASFTSSQLDELLAYFGPQLSGSGEDNRSSDDGTGDVGGPPPEHSNGNGPPFNPWTKGKGKGKGHVTPTDPA